MQNSLTVLLPVKNAQSTLAATVQEILDVASELSEQIELLIIDDGSSDATSEVATELTRNFPQVRTICLGKSLGWEAAIHTGLQESSGKVVLIQEEGGVPLDEIVKNWKDSGVRDELFFRKDAAESEAVKPVSLSPYGACYRKSQPWSGHQSPVSSRPIRPNFLVKTRDNALGE